MAFTTASGLVVGTPSCDLDPGLAPFLARAEGMTPEPFHDLVNHESGRLGVSETRPYFRDLLAPRAVDVRAAEAADLLCYQAKKWAGAPAAALGGLDALVFAGGSARIRPSLGRASARGWCISGSTWTPRAMSRAHR